MFRSMRRHRQSLPQDECVEVLQRQPRGVLAVHGEDGYPYALPMNYIYLDGKLYFHCAKEGHKLDAITADDRVSFCVMDEGFRKPGEWALNIRSVIVFGRAAPVEDAEQARQILRQLSRKYYPTPEEAEDEVRKSFDRACILALTVDHMTGKLVNES